MKRYLGYTSIIILLAYTCSSAYDFAKYASSLSQQYYKDNISLIDIEDMDLGNSDLVKNKIASDIALAIQQKSDAVIFNSNVLTKSILNSVETKTLALDIVQYAADLARNNGLFFFIKINFRAVDNTISSASSISVIKNNFNSLVKNCAIDGYYFYGINFSSKDDNDLFEDILVESMLVKPFLIVSIPDQLGDLESNTVGKYLNNGIIDFIIAEQNGYSIQHNKNLAVNDYQKILSSYLKRFSPEHFISLNLSSIIDYRTNEVEILVEKRFKKIGADKKLNFILTGKSDTLKLKIGNNFYTIPKNDWVIPYNYLLNKDNTVSRYGAWVEFRRPFSKITGNNEYNLLCRTKYPSKVLINNEAVKIYKTGVFFKKIKLKDGLNQLKAEVKDDKGAVAIYEDRVLYQRKERSVTDSILSINDDLILPSENISLTPEDYLTVSFNGTKAQLGFVEITPGNFSFECQRKDFSSFSRYEIQIALKDFTVNQNYSIKLVMKSSDINTSQSPIEKILGHKLQVKNYNDFPLLETIQDNSIFTFTLAPIRLGAPLRNELPKNVILKSNGIFGEYYRIHLSDSEEGYINKEFVRELPKGASVPGYFINPISSYPSASADIIKIPYLENVPFDIYPEPEQKRITINLYGVKTSSTWIIHKNNLRYIDEITWQQTSKETYKIYVNLKSSKIWGYDIKPNGKELIFRIKYPPSYKLKSTRPLKGIKIALEAGHGGNNLGAVGLSGIKEKEINLDLCKKLEVLFKKHGAEVLQVRDSDKYMLLSAKRDSVTSSDANLHLSIHANASDPENEFLGTSGTCTFYHNPFWAKLAEKVFVRLIELDLKPFGFVGSFNYRVTRMSDMPAILVEQAFLSNAEDEEKLADDNFRAKMAEKIYTGLIDYLEYMNN